MSAWYVFSALGIYPQTPGTARMLLGAPVFPSAVIDRPGRKDIVITAPDADDTHIYVEAVRLGGRTLDQSWTGPGLTLSGGRLDFRLAEQPNTQWATNPATLPE
jgi:putative alpha-1,2-mannosidase